MSSLADYILTWASRDAASRAYAESHLKRLEKILAITPLGTKADRVLEMGVYFHITAALKTQLGYGEVRGCYYGRRGVTEHKSVASVSGEVFECDVDLFDAERDPFPYPNGHFSAVLCCELLEHLACDPMHMISEINRILKSGGHLVLTTPNIGSLRAISAILKGYNPGFFPAYIRPSNEGEVEARHSREYTAHEIYSLITDGGFTVTYCDTGPFCEENENDLHWVTKLLTEHNLKSELRGNCTFAVGKKSGPLRQRYPSWLYSV